MRLTLQHSMQHHHTGLLQCHCQLQHDQTLTRYHTSFVIAIILTRPSLKGWTDRGPRLPRYIEPKNWNRPFLKNRIYVDILKRNSTFFCFPYSNRLFINICLYLSLKFKVESVSENQVLLCIISSTSNDINAIYLVINLTKSHHLKSLMIIHDGTLLNKYFYFVGQLYH